MSIRIETPFTKEKAAALKSGDSVLITGTLYTARDAAHQRLIELARAGKPLPFDVRDAILYYVGPSPAKEGQAVGSAGPTTSYRMDAYTPELLRLGLRGMIGKGRRGPEVARAIHEHGAVYFAAVGGAGALLSRCIVGAETVAYEDLGTEAIRKLWVEDFPAVVVMDAHGGDLYVTGPKGYLDQIR